MDVTAEQLFAAADLFAARTDNFAVGKADICRDMARKLERFGSFVSEKQAEFAAKLVQWAQPRTYAPVEALRLPQIESLVRDSDLSLNLGVCKVVLFQSGAVAVVAPVFGAGTYGIIEDGNFRRFKACNDEVVAVLKDVEERGIEAVKEIGRATGRCCVCSRLLTDPESIEAGIGPICASRF